MPCGAQRAERKGGSGSTVEAMVTAAAAEGPQANDPHYLVKKTVPGLTVQDFPAAVGAGARHSRVPRGCLHLHARRSCRAFYCFGTARRQQPIDIGSHSHNRKIHPWHHGQKTGPRLFQRTVQRTKANGFRCDEWYPFPCALTTASIRCLGSRKVVIESRIPAWEFPLYALVQWKRIGKSRTVP